MFQPRDLQHRCSALQCIDHDAGRDVPQRRVVWGSLPNE